ncbi:hypothetical protein ABK040_000388 [Willaertia magna]
MSYNYNSSQQSGGSGSRFVSNPTTTTNVSGGSAAFYPKHFTSNTNSSSNISPNNNTTTNYEFSRQQQPTSYSSQQQQSFVYSPNTNNMKVSSNTYKPIINNPFSSPSTTTTSPFNPSTNTNTSSPNISPTIHSLSPNTNNNINNNQPSYSMMFNPSFNPTIYTNSNMTSSSSSSNNPSSSSSNSYLFTDLSINSSSLNPSSLTSSSSSSSSSPFKSIQQFFLNENLRNFLLKKNILFYLQYIEDVIEEKKNGFIGGGTLVLNNMGGIGSSNTNNINSITNMNNMNSTAEVLMERALDVPKSVDQYHSLIPLDESFWKVNTSNQSEVVEDQIDSTFGQVYRAVDSMSATCCCLRRISEHQLTLEQALNLIEPWFKLKHNNIITLRNLFQTDQFGNINDLIFVYDYFVGAQTLQEYLTNTRVISEGFIWSLICQIYSALREIHNNQLVFRTLNLKKVLILSGGPGCYKKVKLNCCGMVDVLDQISDESSFESLQQGDFKQFGILLVNLLFVKDSNFLSDSIKALELLKTNESKISKELNDIIKYLLEEINVDSNQLLMKLAPKLLDEMSILYNQLDFIENELAKELENGRLFRLLVKLNFVAQHEDYEYHMKSLSSSTSGSGSSGMNGKQFLTDRQTIKLFFDYLFVQISDTNQVILDLGHVVETLNKLDAGTNEKVLLMSRDEQSLIVITFKDLKNIVKTQFSSLLRKK